MYLVLDHIIPSLATQCISSRELENVKRNVEDYAVDPDHSCPSPANTFHVSKGPVGIYSNQGSHLNKIESISFKLSHGLFVCVCVYKYIVSIVTSCARKKANTRSRPGRSIKDQLRDLVTKMSA